MSIERAFLADICANPEDDAPRLIYADWLAEHGDEARAEFIRAQVRRAALPKYDPAAYDLEAREDELLAANEKKWKKPLARITARCEFQRGFLHHLAIPAAKFVTHADNIFTAAPVRSLRVLQVGPGWDQFLDCEGLSRLRSLDLSHSRLGMHRACALARSPRLSELRELDLTSGKILPNGLRAVLASPHLRNLRALSLGGNGLTDALGEAFAQCPFPLKRLYLGGDPLSEISVTPFLCWQHGSGVRDLEIGFDNDDTLRAFLATGWPSLRTLTLRGNAFGSDSQRLLGGASFAALRELRLRCPFTHGLRPLLESPNPPRLELLDVLGGVPFAFDALADSPLLESLRVLHVDGNESGINGLPAVATGRLTELVVSDGRGDALAWMIAATPGFASLRKLALPFTRLGDAGAVDLAGAEHLSRLIELDLSFSEINMPGARALASSPHLAGLRRLRMAFSQSLTADVKRVLQERFGASAVVAR
jgi:uncharacterized protein (TIGR02996 family)